MASSWSDEWRGTRSSSSEPDCAQMQNITRLIYLQQESCGFRSDLPLNSSFDWFWADDGVLGNNQQK